jgi:hypothetical protein
LPDTIRVIKWQEGEMGRAHYVHGRKNAYRVLDENCKEGDHLGRSSNRWEVNMKEISTWHNPSGAFGLLLFLLFLFVLFINLLAPEFDI